MPEIQYLNTQEFDKMKVLNMLNNKYYIYNGQLFGVNQNAMGNAWYVQNIKWADSPDSEINEIATTDVATTAIINNEFKEIAKNPGVDSNARVVMTSYSPKHLVYETNSTKDGLVVFSEVYYEDGWNAYIDGNLQDHFRVNYVLRALRIPAGNHTIEFKFEPPISSA